MKNERKRRNIKLVKSVKRRSYLLSVPHNKVVSRTFVSDKNEQSKGKKRQASLSDCINIRH